MHAARESRSASETATTDSRPSSKHARTTRTAISPRFATSTLRISVLVKRQREERVAVIDGRRILHVNLGDGAGRRRVDMAHQLHYFDDAHRVALGHLLADLDERLGARLG